MSSLTCVFYIREYWSPSGYAWEVQTDGTKVSVDSPYQFAKGANPCDAYSRIEVAPGQHILLKEDDPEEGDSAHLIRVPKNGQFEEFLKKAEKAGVAVYDRINGYKKPGSGPPYDYTENFDGSWLLKFRTRAWINLPDCTIKLPSDLKAALAL